MAASLDRQVSAMDSLAWRISYEWNQARNGQKIMKQMHTVWKDIQESAHYQCLADKRKESAYYLWYYTSRRVLAESQLWGYWYKGEFFANWCDLPEKYKYDDSLLKTLPSGHFWARDGQATTIRYFVSEDCAGEDKSHFPLVCTK
jgi:hypothetical protein